MDIAPNITATAKEKILSIQLEFEPDPIGLAQRYADILREPGVTQQRLADLIGKKRSYIASYVRLLKLPDRVKSLVSKGRLGVGHAKCLLSLPFEMQSRIADEVIRRKWDVRELEAEVKKVNLVQSESLRLSQNLHKRSGLHTKVVTRESGSSFVTFAFTCEKDALDFLKKVENRVASLAPYSD